MEWIL